MRRMLSIAFALSVTVSLGLGPAAPAEPTAPQGRPTATGRGGAAASVDPLATRTAIRVLRHGGNAVDAAVAAAAVLGVVEPYSCGIGGGGFMLIGRGDRVATNDHRETAPAAWEPDTLIDPDTGEPIPFEEAVTSGLSVGVPGTVRGWDRALARFGTMPLGSLLRPAISIARQGFVVDDIFAAQTLDNLERFRSFTSTRITFLTEGQVPRVGSVFRNRSLARTYDLIAERGPGAFYQGELARAIVRTVQAPPETRSSDLDVRPGLMTTQDLARYRAPFRPPTRVSYRGYDVFGMGPPSSGGSTVSEALNILEGFELGADSPTQALHRYIEASSLAFADRNAYLGDSDFVNVPLDGLLSQEFAAERRELIGPQASPKPLPPGDPFPYDGDSNAGVSASIDTGGSTTHLTVSDAAGMVVSYTFTIEQIGGSGIAVPGYGFLLNNELTDFNFEPPHPNAPEGGKRPRSSMSPTIVTKNGKIVLALGSPGGSTIITTALQVLLNRLDFGMTLPGAVAAPRLTPQNAYPVLAEPGFLRSRVSDELEDLGHSFDEIEELGAVAAIEFLSGGRVRAVAEPVRRGGGSAAVENP